MPEIIVIAHNIRSTHNIGSIFRTAEGLGVQKLILSGYSPYPKLGAAQNNSQIESRLPHIANKIDSQIHKTALDAEHIVPFEVVENPDFNQLRAQGYTIIALEQHATSVPLNTFTSHSSKLALLLGEEVNGVSTAHLNECEHIIEIPMNGKKESFNVSVAAGIALYQLSLL